MAFIAFEGGEGVGKTTQLRRLQARASVLDSNREFVFTREPGGTPLGERIRALILSDEANEADGLTMFGLFAAARADHVRLMIRPHLEAGRVVVSDRFFAASFAYQAVAQDNPIPLELFRAHVQSLGIFPDLTIIFDMDPELVHERIERRRVDDVPNHFDLRAIEFHTKIREGYLQFQKLFSSPSARIEMLDANRDVETIHAEIVDLMRTVA